MCQLSIRTYSKRPEGQGLSASAQQSQDAFAEATEGLLIMASVFSSPRLAPDSLRSASAFLAGGLQSSVPLPIHLIN